MKKLSLFIKHLFFLFLIHHSSFIILYGAFEDDLVAARSSALGGVSAVLDNEPSSVLFNPAGLSSLKNTAISVGHTKLYLGLSDGSDLSNTSFLMGFPYKNFSFGFGYKDFSLKDFYKEEIIVGALAWCPLEVISLGVSYKNYTIKIPLNNYLKDDEVFRGGYDKNFTDLTVGGILKIWNFSLGVYREVSDDKNKKHKNLTNNVIGLSYTDNGFSLMADYRDFSNRKMLSVGIEKDLNFLALRAGFGFGSNDYKKVTAGVGLNLRRTLSLDYALIYPLSGVTDISGSHQLTVTARFGIEKKPVRISTKEEYTLPAHPASTKKRATAGLTSEPVILSTSTDIVPETFSLGAPTPTDLSVSTAAVITEILGVEVRPPVWKVEPQKTIQPPPAARTHKVIAGETLMSLSEKYYNTKTKWHLIYQANPDKVEKGMIKPGDILIIP